MFYIFYLAENHQFANNSTIPEAKEKNKRKFGILRILGFLCMINYILEESNFTK